jgi:acyl-CoA dehydrogenase
MNSVIDRCLRASTQVPALETVADWWPRWRSNASVRAAPIEQAIAGGFDADRVGWAFASGYQAALRALVPDLASDALAALCVTEETGNQPRDVRTVFTARADGGASITGSKR